MPPSAISQDSNTVQSAMKETRVPVNTAQAPITSSTLTALKQLYATAEADYINTNPTSKSLFAAATYSLPGGNTRSVLYYPPFPVSTVSAKGCTITDADGHSYIDFLGEYTAGLYGHSEPLIINALKAALDNGLSFGSQHGDESRLAALIKERIPSMELLRFTNSGTEATLMALGLATHYTARKKVVVFENAYHGGAFSFQKSRGSVNVPHEYLIGQYNDLSSVLALTAVHGSEIAAIVIEPMLGSGGAICASKAFLQALREEATRIGALLVFDEVMTSRLYDGGGVQTEMRIKPDLTTLGKYIGGGMSFGAFGGRADIMALFDPRKGDGFKGELSHAGTFNNNVLTMTAGRVGLEKIFTKQVARQLHERGEAFRKSLNEDCKGTLLKLTGCGSIMCLNFTETPLEEITSPASIVKDERSDVLMDLLHLWLLKAGFYIARRGFIALSLPLTQTELDGFRKSVLQFLYSTPTL